MKWRSAIAPELKPGYALVHVMLPVLASLNVSVIVPQGELCACASPSGNDLPWKIVTGICTTTVLPAVPSPACATPTPCSQVGAPPCATNQVTSTTRLLFASGLSTSMTRPWPDWFGSYHWPL